MLVTEVGCERDAAEERTRAHTHTHTALPVVCDAGSSDAAGSNPASAGC